MTEAKPRPIHELLADLADNVGTIRKTEKNQAQGFNFRGVDRVTQAVHPVLVKLGIVVTAEVISYQLTPGPPSGKGTPSTRFVAHVRYTLTGPAGDAMTTDAIGENIDYMDKGAAGAQSVAYRVMWLQLTSSPTDDPDPDSPREDPGPPPAQRRQRAKKSDVPVPEVPTEPAHVRVAKTSVWNQAGKPTGDEASRPWLDAKRTAGFEGVSDSTLNEDAAAAIVAAYATLSAPFTEGGE